VQKDETSLCNKLEQMRVFIDDVDEELISALAKRMKIVGEMGEYKHANNMTILQMDRWRNALKNRMDFGRKNNLDDEFMIAFWRLVHSEALRIQSKSS